MSSKAGKCPEHGDTLVYAGRSFDGTVLLVCCVKGCTYEKQS
jgi:hypothetical protein